MHYFTCVFCFQKKNIDEMVEVQLGNIHGVVCIDCYDTPDFRIFEEKLIKEHEKRKQQETQLARAS